MAREGGEKVVLDVGQAAHFDVPCPGCGRTLHLQVGKIAVGFMVDAAHEVSPEKPSCAWYGAKPDSLSVVMALGFSFPNDMMVLREVVQ